MKRTLATFLILGLFTIALAGCSTSADSSSNGNQAASSDVKELDNLMDSVRTDQYADTSLNDLQ